MSCGRVTQTGSSTQAMPMLTTARIARDAVRDRLPRRTAGKERLIRSSDIVHGTFPDAQAAIATRIQEIMDTVNAQDVETLDSHHLWGPRFSKFDDDPPGRQDAAMTRQIERELVSSATAIHFEASDVKVDVFGSAAVATFFLDYSATMPVDQSFAASVRSTLVFVHDGTDWKIVHEHFSPVPGSAWRRRQPIILEPAISP
jgi:ketosteroid isomerase-like protein